MYGEKKMHLRTWFTAINGLDEEIRILIWYGVVPMNTSVSGDGGIQILEFFPASKNAFSLLQTPFGYLHNAFHVIFPNHLRRSPFTNSEYYLLLPRRFAEPDPGKSFSIRSENSFLLLSSFFPVTNIILFA